MISTEDYSQLPGRRALQQICKALAVADAIISQEWEYRYYSYNAEWAEDEESFQMRDGQGDEMLILFREEGCVINGLAHEYEQPDKKKLTQGLPAIFNEFIFGEPVNSIGTTFCLWSTQDNKWQTAVLESYEDNSGEMLSILDGDPQTYINWATDYFELDFKEGNAITSIYQGQMLTKEMVLSVNEELEDWEQLKADLDEIDYPYDFS